MVVVDVVEAVAEVVDVVRHVIVVRCHDLEERSPYGVVLAAEVAEDSIDVKEGWDYMEAFESRQHLELNCTRRTIASRRLIGQSF